MNYRAYYFFLSMLVFLLPCCNAVIAQPGGTVDERLAAGAWQVTSEVTIERIRRDRDAVVSAMTTGKPEMVRSLLDSVQACRKDILDGGWAGWKKHCLPTAATDIDRLQRIWNADEPPSQDDDPPLKLFFLTAMTVFGRLQEEIAVVGFYQFWSDCWLLTEWKNGEKPLIQRITMLSGEWMRLRGNPPFDPRPDWQRRKDFVPDATMWSMVDNSRCFDATVYGTADWRKVLRLDTRESEIENADHAFTALNISRFIMNYLILTSEDTTAENFLRGQELTSHFFTALDGGSLEVLIREARDTPGETAQALRNLPGEYFDSLFPIQLTSEGKYTLVFLMSETTPDIAMALHGVTENGKTRLRRLDILNYRWILQQATVAMMKRMAPPPGFDVDSIRICLDNLKILEGAARAKQQIDTPPATTDITVQLLLDEGWVRKNPVCSAGGKYQLIPQSANGKSPIDPACSLHGSLTFILKSLQKDR